MLALIFLRCVTLDMLLDSLSVSFSAYPILPRTSVCPGVAQRQHWSPWSWCSAEINFIPFGWAYPELACHWRTHLLTQLVPSLMRALDGNSVEEGHGACSIQGIGACHPDKGERVVTDVVWICLVKIWFYSNWSSCFLFVVCKLCYCFKFSRDTVALYCLYPEWITPTSPPWGQERKDSRNHFPSAPTPAL